jgi:hypothetical protein
MKTEISQQECRLLGYKNQVRTSQETHHVSTTQSSQLMLFKIWGFHGSDYEECRLLGNKNPVRTSQETHYVSATESSQLMLCKIWGFNGSDYEECHLLGYQNRARTSQETHYLSATKSSRLMPCKVWGFDDGDYEECRFPGCYVVWLLKEPTFRSIYRLHYQCDKKCRARNNVVYVVTANVLPSSSTFITLMMETVTYSETSVLARATLRNNREDGILHYLSSNGLSLATD